MSKRNTSEKPYFKMMATKKPEGGFDHRVLRSALRDRYGRSFKIQAGDSPSGLCLAFKEETSAGEMQCYIFPDELLAEIDGVDTSAAYAFILWLAALYPGGNGAYVYNDNNLEQHLLVGSDTTPEQLAAVFSPVTD